MVPAKPGFFDLQGHRGARGLRPENTLPAFEAAFDLGVTSVETDVHLTRDSVPVLYHDPALSARLCRRLPGCEVPEPETGPAVRTLSLAQLRCYRADRNPDPERFPDQDAGETPAARLFAEQHGFDVYTPPGLADLFAFAGAYASDVGARAGKTPAQRAAATYVQFAIELKRVPYRGESIGDGFDGRTPGLLEERAVDCIRAAGVLVRTTVRSFDHRSVRAVRELEPNLATAVLVAETAPVSPAQIARDAGALVYCPEYDFLDEGMVRQAQAAGVRVIPWTVNEPEDWLRLLDWGVDGITTDFPDRLAALLVQKGIPF
jgi:glycerophosphoryl diester phosphodiesterase